MGIDKSPGGYSDFDQLKKYARDLAEVYRAEKEKRKELEAANRQLIKYADDLGKTHAHLKFTYQSLQEAYLDTIHRLVIAAEYKDEDTGGHIIRMSRYSALIADKLGLPARDVRNIFYAAPMHDVGKIGIPDSILLKPSKLSDEEFEIMKDHTTIGANVLADSRSEVLQVAHQIAISHHEKWNGRGYPLGLAGDGIPLAGRIVGLPDTFDALTSRRPYKEPYPLEIAYDIIRKERGQQFDPGVVDVFMEVKKEVREIKEEADAAGDVSYADFVWSERDRSAGGAGSGPL
ncbi:MAG: HD domain-containing protein [Desulfobacterales bacterium]|nr:HD domain-containing protein [Desulfobacterales bacterium]